MANVVRDPRFSMSLTEGELPRHIHYARVPFTKQFERRLVHLWKMVMKNGRKQPRNSFISRDFVTVTSRRRSTYYPQLANY